MQNTVKKRQFFFLSSGVKSSFSREQRTFCMQNKQQTTFKHRYYMHFEMHCRNSKSHVTAFAVYAAPGRPLLLNAINN